MMNQKPRQFIITLSVPPLISPPSTPSLDILIYFLLIDGRGQIILSFVVVSVDVVNAIKINILLLLYLKDFSRDLL